MKKRTVLSFFATALLAGAVLSGCGNDEKTAVEPVTTESEVVEETDTEDATSAVETVAVEESLTGKQLTAYHTMMDEAGKAKEGQVVDWELVSMTYTEGLQSAVTEVDESYDQGITAAIGAAINSEIEPIIAKQLVDKLSQAYFYQKQKNLHKDVIAALEAKDQPKAEAAFEEIKFLVNGLLLPTAMKRDEYYKFPNDSSMEENILTGLSTQEEALKAGNLDDYKVFLQITDKSVYRSYFLAARSYAEKIEAAVKEGKSGLDLQIMQAEAWGFYQAIKGSLSGGDEAAAARLDEIFSLSTTPAETIKAQEVQNLFVKAIVGKITGYHEKVVTSLAEEKVVDARIQALEGNMFSKAIELDLKAKLGEDKAVETLKQAEEWYNAIIDGNKDKASTHSKAVVDALTELVK
ncbi:hypothetical protein ACOI1C_03720 [Bacillus sp. DJP31]|uniref:hypothetical protein n=1 Tax=Bacillus sp. DJP31 TaxID=3409789 RepID=UPI003BB73EFB